MMVGYQSFMTLHAAEEYYITVLIFEPSLTSTMNSMPTSSIPQATLRILPTTKKTMAGACERFKRLLKSLLPEHQLSLQQKDKLNHRMLESHLVQIARQIQL